MIWNPTRVRMLALGACTCLLWGCAATPEPHPTKLQVTITGTSVDRVKTALVSEMSKRKFRVAKDSGQNIAFEQPASSTALQGLVQRGARKSD